MSTWIPATERLPTAEDANNYHAAVLWILEGGLVETYDYRDAYCRAHAVAWMPIPLYNPPEPDNEVQS